LYLGQKNITLFQVGLPKPIKKSLKKYPTKILKIAKIINGKIIKKELS